MNSETKFYFSKFSISGVIKVPIEINNQDYTTVQYIYYNFNHNYDGKFLQIFSIILLEYFTEVRFFYKNGRKFSSCETQFNQLPRQVPHLT